MYYAETKCFLSGKTMDARRADIIKRGIGSHILPTKYSITEEEEKEFREAPLLGSANTCIADYVWLPITIKNQRVQIEWYEKWSIEEFE